MNSQTWQTQILMLEFWQVHHVFTGVKQILRKLKQFGIVTIFKPYLSSQNLRIFWTNRRRQLQQDRRGAGGSQLWTFSTTPLTSLLVFLKHFGVFLQASKCSSTASQSFHWVSWSVPPARVFQRLGPFWAARASCLQLERDSPSAPPLWVSNRSSFSILWLSTPLACSSQSCSDSRKSVLESAPFEYAWTQSLQVFDQQTNFFNSPKILACCHSCSDSTLFPSEAFCLLPCPHPLKSALDSP